MIEHVWCGGCVERGAALTQELSSIRDVLVRAGAAVERVGVDDHWHPVSPAQQVYELATERDDLVRERDELHRLVCNARAYINPKEHSEWEAAAAEEAENCDAKMARLSQERDAARFEVEELREALRVHDQSLAGCDYEDERRSVGMSLIARIRALLSCTPTLAALRAREALTARTSMEASEAWWDTLRRGQIDERDRQRVAALEARSDAAKDAYLAARAAREQAEKAEAKQ